MKFLYIGYAIPLSAMGEWLGPSVAGNNMEIGFLNGLSQQLADNLEAFTITPIAQFPRGKIYIKKCILKLSNSVHSLVIPFINVPFIKQLTIIINLFISVVRWGYKNRDSIIITYNANTILSLPVIMASLFYPFYRVCLFSDPPIDLIEDKGIKGFFKKFDNFIFAKLINNYNAIIAVNEEAVNHYTPGKPYIIINGGVSQDIFCQQELPIENIPFEENTIKILFTGALTKYNGIEIIIDTINILPPNYRLYIFGNGPLIDFVIDSANKNSKIFYGGQVSNQIIHTIQKKVDILINPRVITDPISKYAFPSKLIEYMASAKPVITTRVNALTSEYYPYLYFVDEETPKGFYKIIRKVAEEEHEQALEKGRKARIFILENKTWPVLSKRIIDFITDTFK